MTLFALPETTRSKTWRSRDVSNASVFADHPACALRSILHVKRESPRERSHQGVAVDGLLQNVHGTRLHRPHA